MIHTVVQQGSEIQILTKFLYSGLLKQISINLEKDLSYTRPRLPRVSVVVP